MRTFAFTVCVGRDLQTRRGLGVVATALLMLGACSSAVVNGLPPEGSITLVTSTINAGLAPVQYTVMIDGSQSTSIGTDARLTMPNVAAGTHSLQLTGLGATCRVPAAKSVTVTDGGTVEVAIVVLCSDGTPAGNRIAFAHSGSGGVNGIYLMNTDGSGLVNLTNHGTSPSWSPDGSRIAFTSSLTGKIDIYTVRVDGTGLFRVTSSEIANANATWSPDGAWIAFDSRRPAAALFDIYIIHPDGTSETNLTSGGSTTCSLMPGWSPDGTRIAFRRENCSTGLNSRVYAINSDGSSPVRLEAVEAEAWSPTWSPDGRKILFFTAGLATPAEIYLMNADGSNAISLTALCGCPSTEDQNYPHWSSDGTKIVFSSSRSNGTFTGNSDVYVMDADGSNVVRLTNSFGDNGLAVWRPR